MYALYQGIKNGLSGHNYDVDEAKEIPYGLQFLIKGEASGMLRIYSNKKKRLKVDCSQLKGNIPAVEAILMSASALKSEDSGRGKAAPLSLGKKTEPADGSFDLGYPIIGSDESGKGDYFGPLVSAAVYVDEESAAWMEALGVKDSKKITDAKALELAAKIRKTCDGKYAVIEISPLKYNGLYRQLKKEGKNLNSLLAWGHAKAIEEILRQTDCQLAIADKFADEKYILGKLQEKGKKIQLIQRPRAEENIAVAAASILARERFLLKLKQLSDECGVHLPKGASARVIEAAETLMRQQGKEGLAKVAKLHFKTTLQLSGMNAEQD
ncbi:MAG: ribonuclease HIII [Peptococcaceae bacterium]|nr:ribonuclease HIII [Peptococcaceae bacterium]